MLANANHDFISRYEESLKDFVKSGGKIRYLLLNPASDAMRVFSARSGGAEKDLAEVCLKMISNIAKAAPPRAIQVKLINQLPSAVVTMLNRESQDGLIFTSLCGFNQFFLSRPGLILHKNRDPKLFQFYQTYFENLWSWNETVAIDLNRKCKTDYIKYFRLNRFSAVS